MNASLLANPGSFRDPVNRVYETSGSGGAGGLQRRILRGLDAKTLEIYRTLATEAWFNRLVADRRVVGTVELTADDTDAQTILTEGWSGVLEHEVVPFVSYPYEWTFSMLRDAALLQLQIVEQALENGWTLKDATPYNIQFVGSRPVFIDIPSFQPWTGDEPWVGYRQFCSMFLVPLMLKAYVGIDHRALLRSRLDGIPPIEAARFFTGSNRFRKGVLSHVIFPARVEAAIAKRERDDAVARKRRPGKQSEAMVIGLVQSLARLVRKIVYKTGHTNWSQYDKTHSYQEPDFDAKKTFVQKHVAAKSRRQIWDIGCNTGTFSKISGKHCEQVIAVDGDHDAVERLYSAEKTVERSNLLPLVMDIANISPAQGWAGQERMAFDKRQSPDLILCLALIHHVRMSANIPNALFIRWLRSLNADVILEFVNREDEMVVKLLTNKKEQYEDYNLPQFLSETEREFEILDRAPLKGGKRELFLLAPR